MGHLKRRSLSPQQGGFTRTFRGEAEITGNYLERRALDKDDIDAAQTTVFIDKLDGEIKSGIIPLIRLKSSIDFTVEGGGISPGDFVAVDGIDGYFQLTGVTESDGGTNNVALIDTFPLLVNESTGALASNVLTDASVADFLNLGPSLIDTEVRVGDRVDIFSGLNIRQVFLVLAVTSGAVTLDGIPVDDTAFTYRITRPPRLAEFPLGEDGQTGLRFRVAKGLAQEQGAPPLTRFPGFGDPMLSRNINRGMRALSQNTQYLKLVTESPIAIPTRVETLPGHGGSLELDITGSIGTAGIFTGNAGGSIPVAGAAIAQILRVYGIDGLDIEVGGVTVKVNDIQDGTSTSILNRGFVLPADVGGTIKVVFNLTIVDAQGFVVTFGQGQSWEDLVATDPGAFMRGEFVLLGVDDEVIPELVASRDSERLGSATEGTDFAVLDDRLEAIEARQNHWYWLENLSLNMVHDPVSGGDQDFSIRSTGSVCLALSNGQVYAIALADFPINGGQGFIKVTLDAAALTGTLSSIDDKVFDPSTDLLSGLGINTSPAEDVEFIIGSWSTTNTEINLYHSSDSSSDLARVPNSLISDGVILGSTVVEQGTPDTTVSVQAGSGLINGRYWEHKTLNITPTAVGAVSSRRITLLSVDQTGQVIETGSGVKAGVTFAPFEAQATPGFGVIPLARIFLRSDGAGVTLPIRDADNGTDSFIVLNLQRFAVPADNSEPHRHPSNMVRNGGFINGDPPVDWTVTGGATVARDTGQKLFGDHTIKVTNVASVGRLEQSTGSAPGDAFGDIRNYSGPGGAYKFYTISAYILLDPAGSVDSATANLNVSGTAFPTATVSATVNKSTWQRIHVTSLTLIQPTAVDFTLQITGDTSGGNSTVWFVDGVQLTIGKGIYEFEYPQAVKQRDDGSIEFDGDLEIGSGGLTADGDIVTSTGAIKATAGLMESTVYRPTANFEDTTYTSTEANTLHRGALIQAAGADNGSGAALPGSQSINVASRSNPSTGIYTYTWDKAFSDLFYVVVAITRNTGGGTRVIMVDTQGVGSVTFSIRDGSNALVNSEFMFMAMGPLTT